MHEIKIESNKSKTLMETIKELESQGKKVEIVGPDEVEVVRPTPRKGLNRGAAYAMMLLAMAAMSHPYTHGMDDLFGLSHKSPRRELDDDQDAIQRAELKRQRKHERRLREQRK